MLKNLSVYSFIGVINTALHWMIFYSFHANITVNATLLSCNLFWLCRKK